MTGEIIVPPVADEAIVSLLFVTFKHEKEVFLLLAVKKRERQQPLV